MLKEQAKELIIERVNDFRLSEEKQEQINKKRKYFQEHFSKKRIQELDRDHYFQGHGIKKENFTYDLEWNSKCLGGIGGGSVYKFGYEEDFDEIKKLLTTILSAGDAFDQFYAEDGELTRFSKEIIKKASGLKGVSRTLIGKVLAIYYPGTFLGIYVEQDRFLEEIYSDYKPEANGVDLYLRNNFLLLDIKNKYAAELSNDEFYHLLYELFPKKEKGIEEAVIAETQKIEALEVQHYQSLLHRNFRTLFKDLRYYDQERQSEKNGHFDTQEVGVLDFLASDTKDNLIVIEIKRHSTDKTLGQILRYMGWVEKNLRKDKQKVKGLIVAESKDNRLEYALSIVPDVTFKRMKLRVEIED